jgi:hypothetical protein
MELPTKETRIPRPQQMATTVEVDTDMIINKHTKIVHKIYSKMKTLVLSTNEVVGEHNVALLLARVMRELNKTNLYGFEKHQLAVVILMLLLDSVGCPHTASAITAEAVVKLVEFIYASNMHRYDSKGRCIIL